jgi:transposase
MPATDCQRNESRRLVTAHAARLGVELLFLPPYAPNLNLIERLWKFVKKECLYSYYSEERTEVTVNFEVSDLRGCPGYDRVKYGFR